MKGRRRGSAKLSNVNAKTSPRERGSDARYPSDKTDPSERLLQKIPTIIRDDELDLVDVREWSVWDTASPVVLILLSSCNRSLHSWTSLMTVFNRVSLSTPGQM